MVRWVRHDDICKLIDELFVEESEPSKPKIEKKKTKSSETKKTIPIANIFFAVATILLLVIAGSAVVYMQTPSDSIDELLAELEAQNSISPLSMDEKFLKWMREVESEIDDYNKHISKGFIENKYDVVGYWAAQLEKWIISQQDVWFDVSDEYKPIQESYQSNLEYTEYRAYCLKKVAQTLSEIKQ